MAQQHETVLGRLAKRRLGVLHIFFFTVAASAPLTVLGGGVTTTYAVSGNLGVPLSFLILAALLGLFAVGYAAMSRHVSNAGAFYAYLANGLGRAWGVAASAVALLSYNAIQIGLYGLFGFFVSFLTHGEVRMERPVVGLGAGRAGRGRDPRPAASRPERAGARRGPDLRVRRGRPLRHRRLRQPRCAGVTTTGLLPADLFTDNVGAVFALGVAAFIGFESAAIYGEESKDPRRTVARATYAALAFTGVFYALSAWAMQVTVGSENIATAAADPVTGGPGLLFGTMAGQWSPLIADLAERAVRHQRLRRAAQLPQRRRALPLRAGSRTGDPPGARSHRGRLRRAGGRLARPVVAGGRRRRRVRPSADAIRCWNCSRG